VLTARKLSIAVGDDRGARSAADYLLEYADSPAAFAAALDGRGDEAPGRAGWQANSMWLGSDAALEQLGVQRGAEVSVEDLTRALQGLNVQTGRAARPAGNVQRDVVDADGQVVRDADGKPVRTSVKVVRSFDFTFSAPKSVSVVWSQAGPEQRRAIEQAMLTAAYRTVEHLMQTREVVKVGGRLVPARGVVVAAVLHVTARRAAGEAVPAPQLHVHMATLGVERPDGQLAGIEPLLVYKQGGMLEAGAVFRADLADELVSLGYPIESDTGKKRRFFEIAGVARRLIEAMSGRTREVEERRREIERERGGPLSGPALGMLAAETRQKKDKDLDPEETVGVWRVQGQEFDAGREHAAALVGEPGYREELGARRRAVWEGALRRIRERGPTVSRGEAAAAVYEAAAGRLSRDEARDVLNEMGRAGALIVLEDGSVTSREIRSAEQQVLDAAEAAAQRGDPPLSRRARDHGLAAASAALGEGRSLSEEQREAFEKLTAGAGWAILTGRAGTGKGPTLHAVAEAYRAEGWQVIACAADGRTARQMGAQVRGPSFTLKSVQARTELGTLTLNDRTLLLLDEASKVGLEDWYAVAGWAQRHRIRVVAVGHDGQHEAVQLPGMFTELLAGPAIPVAHLAEIRRHVDPADPERAKVHPWLRDYQVALDSGAAREAVDILRAHDAIKMYDTRLEAMEGMVADWDSWRREYGPRESLMVIQGSDADVDAVNRLAQERRMAAELGEVGIQAPDRDYRLYEGDLVIVRRAAYHISGPRRERRVENGQIGLVRYVDVERGRVWVAFDEPGTGERTVPIDVGWLRAQHEAGRADTPALRLAYAHHSFPIQGETVLGSASLDGHWSEGKESAYPAHTRARERHSVHVSREDLGVLRTGEDPYEAFAKRLARSIRRGASIRHEIDPDTSVVQRAPVVAPVPKLAPPTEARAERAAQAGQKVVDAVEPIAAPDPLDRFRRVLGPARSGQVDQQAATLAHLVRGRETGWLHDERERLAGAWEALDRRAALQALRMERDRRIVEARLSRADGPGAGPVRARHGERDRQTLDRLREVDAALRETGAHPDTWVERHGDAAARWVAVSRELAARHELDEARDAEHVATRSRDALATAVQRHTMEADGREA
jgi:conjugative relaxase-like TrwC/TraI family protein